ncbi:MAG: PHP domain-containing protein [Chloroflexi bacterium]|nr:PHP domain-containing protein [Chloroflexota bacterium]MCH8224188.1 PHP domain-containing protein [Chloroflexota bacterium]
MSKSRWLKGNLHTHTTASDGDASPEYVAAWYREHGYDFLVLSDHNHVTILDEADSKPGEWPLLIPGEEVSSRIFDRTKPVHVGGIGLRTLVEPADEGDIRKTLQENVRRVVAEGALASINHPNHAWAITAEDIVATEGAWALEVFNGHPDINTFGGGGHPSPEEMWDFALSRGKRILGVATDDSHHYVDEFSPQLGNPGRGWIVVNVEKESEEALMEGMRQGDFYASTGVNIHDMKVARDEIVIEFDPYRAELFTTVFRGKHGRELATEEGQEVRFVPPAGELYVRATVYSSRGPMAWSQPLFSD